MMDKEKYTILVVEDAKINRMVLIRILQNDYKILEATNGLIALDMLYQHHNQIAAMIIDLKMPEMAGYDLLEAIQDHKDYKKIPILVATDDSDFQTEERCLQLGANDFIKKPYVPEILRYRLNNIIQSSNKYLLNQLELISKMDNLTGIYNRHYFMKKTKEMIMKHSDIQFALIRIDIDRFRMYNSFFGKQGGDKLLQNIGQKLRTLKDKEPICTYGHIESDIFCVCVPYHEDCLEKELLALVKKLEEDHQDYCLEFSFGVYIITDCHKEIEGMYSAALLAAKQCKDRYDRLYSIYDESMFIDSIENQKIINDMQKGIDNKEFVVYYQPKYELKGKKPDGAEALVRWHHPQQGIISPNIFIPIFEQNGFINQLDGYMLEEVCRFIKSRIDANKPTPPVSVNVSRVTLYNPHLIQLITEMTNRYEIPHSLIQFEITESAYMYHPDFMRDVVKQLREEGFTILMDDFGSGYSSLNTLKNIEVDILKIDMNFLPQEEYNVKSEKILASISRMADWLGMTVIVEGVETKDQLEFIESIGCDYIQGFYYAKPLLKEDYEKLIDQTKFTNERKELRSEHMDIDQFFDSDPRVNALFRGIRIPFVIYEYDGKNYFHIRANDSYIESFKMRHAILSKSEEQNLLAAFDEVLKNHFESECSCSFVYQDGVIEWYEIKLKYIMNSETSYIISGTFYNMTAQKKLEVGLNRLGLALTDYQPNRESILIVDDSPMSRDILKATFELQYDIIEASDGEEAMQILEKESHRIVLILLDMFMPKMNGQEFLKHKNNHPELSNIPVIVISSHDDQAFQIHMLENGVNDYITKPFVPEILKNRVRNVLDYQSRFKRLVQEYHMNHEDLDIRFDDEYRVDQMRGLLKFLNQVFEVARLVDPTTTSVLEIDETNQIHNEAYTCYNIWKKDLRCDNCSSLDAYNGQCIMTKYEFIENDIFYVVSKPIKLILDDNEEKECVMEIVSRVADHLLMSHIGDRSVRQIIEDTQTKIYTDPLTKAYNRRYFSEMLFLKTGQARTMKEIAIVMIDLGHFKMINDKYGHVTGDEVLKDVASSLINQVRQNDSVIRYGGDEFIVVLVNCKENKLHEMVERLRHVIEDVTYGENQHVKVALGYAHTHEFKKDDDVLKQLVEIADKNMYLEKNKQKMMDS